MTTAKRCSGGYFRNWRNPDDCQVCLLRQISTRTDAEHCWIRDGDGQ